MATRVELRRDLDQFVAARYARPAVQALRDEAADQMRRFAPNAKTWLCLGPDTPVAAWQVRAAARRTYDGPLVRITTASGRCLAVTPEHRVLTRHGWCPAEALYVGDDLVQVTGVEAAGTPGVKDAPARIGQVVDALMQMAPARKVRTMPMGVHLDGDLTHGEIEVVPANRMLRERLQPGGGKRVPDWVLIDADALGHCPVLSGGDVAPVLLGVTAAAIHGRQLRSPMSVDVLGLPGDAQPTGSRPPAHVAARFPQDTPHSRLRASVRGGQVALRRALRVVTHHVGHRQIVSPLGHASDPLNADAVVAVEQVWHRGHVYDLSTDRGWYLADGLIVHNSARDERVRPSHVEVDGSDIPANLRYQVPRPDGGGHELADAPRDPALSPGNRLGPCRCESIAVPGAIARTVVEGPVLVQGPRVSATVTATYNRLIESEYPGAGDEGGGWMRAALRRTADGSRGHGGRV